MTSPADLPPDKALPPFPDLHNRPTRAIMEWAMKAMDVARAPLEAKLAERDAEIERLKARRKADPIERLHNICDALNEQKDESPYDEKSWDLADESNRILQKEVAHWKACHNTANKILAEACRKIEEMEQSAEVADRRMRDLVAEHMRERDALSERVRELEHQLTDIGN